MSTRGHSVGVTAPRPQLAHPTSSRSTLGPITARSRREGEARTWSPFPTPRPSLDQHRPLLRGRPVGDRPCPMPQGRAAAQAFPSPSMPWSQLLTDRPAQFPGQGRPAGVERPHAVPWGDGRHPLIKSGTHVSGLPQRVPRGGHAGEPEKGIRCETLRSTHVLGLRSLDGTALRELTEVSQALCLLALVPKHGDSTMGWTRARTRPRPELPRCPYSGIRSPQSR